jgi:hypothetical protein
MGVPQASQYFALARSSVPQLAQLEASAAPQPSQKRAAARFSCPQAGQLTA